MPAYSGKFNGKKYKFGGFVESKSQANWHTKKLRASGKKARARKVSGGYHIWHS